MLDLDVLFQLTFFLGPVFCYVDDREGLMEGLTKVDSSNHKTEFKL